MLHPAHAHVRRRGSVLRASVTLGVGLGALAEGIAFRRLLGWHAFLGGWTSDPAVGRLAEGLFDAGAWLVTLLGVYLLWDAWRKWAGEPRPTSRLVGGLLAGAGGALFVEALVAHHLLSLHHVSPRATLAWDVGLLVGAAAISLCGMLVARASSRRLDRVSGGRRSGRAL